MEKYGSLLQLHEKLEALLAEPGDDQLIQDCKDALCLLRSLKDMLGPRFEAFFIHIDNYIENRTNYETFSAIMDQLLGGDPFMEVIVSDTIRMIDSLKERVTAESWCKDELDHIRSKVIQPDTALALQFQISSPEVSNSSDSFLLGSGSVPLHNSAAGLQVFSENLNQPISSEQQQLQLQQQDQQRQQEQQQQLQLQPRQHEQHDRPPFWGSIQYALQAMKELGPSFPEFGALLGCFKIKSIDVEVFSTRMKQLLEGHNKLWPTFEACLQVLNTESQGQQQVQLRQWWQQWFSFLVYLTEVLVAVGLDSYIFYHLWESFHANSINLETLRAGMEPLLRGHDELWLLFQSYLPSEQERLQQKQHQQQ